MYVYTHVLNTDGVVLIDPDYFGREGKKDRKGIGNFGGVSECSVFFCVCVSVFAQVLAGFRYGRDDLDVLGLNFRRDLIDVHTIRIGHT